MSCLTRTWAEAGLDRPGLYSFGDVISDLHRGGGKHESAFARYNRTNTNKIEGRRNQKLLGLFDPEAGSKISLEKNPKRTLAGEKQYDFQPLVP
ncbi:hypothetical protein PoB_007546700 [Plakobranchus ocellatus]|uniref:Uncharacterized protein n=1 Tax=Plakobranchus ocellatus TaxID=259542 RepID=A0AAV4DXB8_9GAST|nr:hypothetical protein PoB_007546700 [Plakobranchus ocellatus]